MKIAYLHGLESSIDPKDPKIIFLNNNFDEVYTPSIDYRDKNTFTRLYNDIKSMQPDVIVGSSMGGYVSYLIGSKLRIETILFNPAVSGRTFDPIVDDTKLKGSKHTVYLGKSDNVIIGSDVKEFFKEQGSGSFNYQSYSGGHRVPADVFISSIKKATGVSEIYNVQNNNKLMKNFEQFINEKREDVGKYNTVKKAIKAIKKEYGPTPTEQSVASFINDNYYDVTEVERGDDDPQANDKIADLVASYKFDIDDWEIAWADAQNESVVTEGKMPTKFIGNDEIVFLKTKENSRGAHYNLYYKGHDIDTGGYLFRSEEELKRFADNYILSNQLYNKLKYEDSKPLPESAVTESETIYHQYDFEGMWAQKLGMTREEYVAHFATMTMGIDEAKIKDSSGKKFEPKGISITYTDRGRFYGAYLFDVAKTANVQWRAKLRSVSELTEFLALNDINAEVPDRYEEKELDVICKQLSKKGIVCDYDDSMDVS